MGNRVLKLQQENNRRRIKPIVNGNYFKKGFNVNEEKNHNDFTYNTKLDEEKRLITHSMHTLALAVFNLYS